MTQARYVFHVAVVIGAALIGFDLGYRLIQREDALRIARANARK